MYATYCAYDGLEEEEALYEAIKTNEFDMTKLTFPRHADGTRDYERGGGVPGKKIVNGGTGQRITCGSGQMKIHPVRL